MRINLDNLKGMVEAYLGREGVATLSAEEWGEFTELANNIVKMHHALVELLPKSTPDIKEVAELAKRFSHDAMDFAGRYTFGKDIKGEPVNFLTLLGDIRMAHIGAAFYTAEFFVLLWGAEHKISTKLRDYLRETLSGEEISEERRAEMLKAAGKRPKQYVTVPILDHTKQ